MTTYSINKVTAFARRAANLFERFLAELQGKGFDAADCITQLKADADALPVSDEEQEHAKTVLKNSTAAIEDETHAAYLKGVGVLKAAAGILGKRSAEAEEAGRIHDSVQKDRNPGQVSAFLTSVIAFLNKHTAALVAKKYNPAAAITQLTALVGALTTDKGAQESAKQNRGDATSSVIADKDELYDYANSVLDAAVGLYMDSPGSEFVKEVQRIRGELRTASAPAQPPPAPAPQPPAPPQP